MNEQSTRKTFSKTDERPWGQFKQYTFNETSTVKILTLKAHQHVSLQSHKHRDELWIPLDEGLQIRLGEKIFQPKIGEEIWIPRGTVHRVGALDKDARVLEIAFGTFDENDIERYEDIYGRS